MYIVDTDFETNDGRFKGQYHYHENELCSGLQVRQTKQDCPMPGHDYEELRDLRALHRPFALP